MAEATVSKKTYVLVAAALMVLLGLTWGTHYVPFGGTFHIVAAMVFALAKMLLIVLFFMHVRYSSRTTIVVASLILLWMLILFVLTFGDYVTRDWLGPAYTPGQATSVLGHAPAPAEAAEITPASWNRRSSVMARANER